MFNRMRLKEYRIFFSVIKLFIKNTLRIKKLKRSESHVVKEYDKAWKTPDYLLEKSDSPPGPMRLGNNTLVLWRRIDRKKYIFQNLANHFSSLRSEKILELGSGGGINLLTLAVMCPWVKTWHGVEITSAGIEASKRLLAEPPYEALIYLTGQSKEDIQTVLKKVDIQFFQGNMLNLPYQENAFDCLFSLHSFEQLPRDYDKAFQEARRVTARYAIFIEPFAEAQRHLIHRLYAMSKNFFRYSYAEVEKAGFKVLLFEPLISIARHCTGLLLCKK